jgi:hypothetical protein
MDSLPSEIVAAIANPVDAHPKHMISVLDIEDASGVAVPEAYKVFGCATRAALVAKVATLEEALDCFFDALIDLLQNLNPGGIVEDLSCWPPVWNNEDLDAESTLRWLAGKVWDDGDLMINNEDESVWEDLWTRMEALFRSLPPWSNFVLKRELGIDLPDTAYTVDRTFGGDKMTELDAWFEDWKPITSALETMDVEALAAGAAKMEGMAANLSSYREQMQLHAEFVDRFVRR